VSGYASELDRPGAQRGEYVEFVKKQLYPTLKAAADGNLKGGDADRLGVTFGGPIITEYEVVQALIQDVSLAGVGLMVVAVYMWAHLDGSVFLTLAGMFEIAISFPAAYFFYRVVMGLRYVSILQFLSVFVILGIGVDDIFVFFDTFRQATAATGRDSDLVLRLSYTYKHAGRAMLVTSFTSAAAFCSNLASAIPAVQVFGIFIAIMVVLNYIAVVSWFPACVAFWETRLLNKGGGGSKLGCCRSVPRPLAASKAFIQARAKAWCPRWHDAVATWSFKSYAEFLQRRRHHLLALAAALTLVACFFASQLPASSEVPKLFPPGHNVQRFIDWTQVRFADESLDCVSYTECAEVSKDILDEMGKSPPAPGLSPYIAGAGNGTANGTTGTGTGTGTGAIVPFTDQVGRCGINPGEAALDYSAWS